MAGAPGGKQRFFRKHREIGTQARQQLSMRFADVNREEKMNHTSTWKKIASAALFAGTLALSNPTHSAHAAALEASDPLKLVLLDWTGNHLTNHIAG